MINASEKAFEEWFKNYFKNGNWETKRAVQHLKDTWQASRKEFGERVMACLPSEDDARNNNESEFLRICGNGDSIDSKIAGHCWSCAFTITYEFMLTRIQRLISELDEGSEK